MKPTQFIFESYSFDEKEKIATFDYSFNDSQVFSESYKFDFDFINYDHAALDRALQVLFFVAGISYFKAYLPNKIIIKKGEVDKNLALFLNKTYQKGLGELLYKNNLDPNLQISFPVNSHELEKINLNQSGELISIGGGKDSLVSYETLKNSEKLATWSVGHKNQLSPLIKKVGSKHFWIERKIDQKLIDLNSKSEVFNGHIPISAIFAAVGTLVSILSGYKDSIVSNEQSANESTLNYKGVEINHQYSKTSEFELSYQSLLENLFGSTIRYYSLMRPLREIMIAREFTTKYLDKYYSVFSSCNRAFTQSSEKIFWCGKCPKCAATYLLFAPFVSEEKLVDLFSKILLVDKEQENTYRQLLGIAGQKPLECVGEIAENRWAMTKMKPKYKQLEVFAYEDAKDTDVWSIAEHNIPKDVLEKFSLESKFQQISAL